MRRVCVLKRGNISRIQARRRHPEKKHHTEDDEEIYENDQERQTDVSLPDLAKPRQSQDEVGRNLTPGASHQQYRQTDLPFSDDVWSSMSRSFENKLTETDKGPGAWSTMIDWSLDPDSAAAFYWKAAVTISVIYNYVVIIFRTAFSEMRGQRVFIILDLVSDVVYILDIVIELKSSFLSDGCLVTDFKQTFRHYKGKQQFLYDILSVFPVQTLVKYVAHVCFMFQSAESGTIIFWKYFDDYKSILRLNRLLKCNAMDKFFQQTESRTNNPNLLRAFKLSLHLGLVIHWIACLYYMLSECEGLGTNDWVYPLEPNVTRFSRKYILSMYWSTMTLTTIGERPPPVTDLEYIFTGFTFLVGVFVFAAVVGNVGDVISNMNAARRDFQARMDQIKVYMNHRKVPEHLQNRIKRWAEYTWDRTKAIDEPSALQFLPDRLRAEVAIHVHLCILKKVSIFDECEEGLLRELVLKLRPQIFSPGDYICRIGEIGRDMYIINHGKVEILFPDFETGDMIQVALMQAGNFFGEISLLKLDDGQNKRTADVRSVGFSELLCLSRRDLLMALTEYPEAKKILENYARQRMNNTRKLSPPDSDENKNVFSPVSSYSKRTARQVFSQVMRKEGFAQLLTKVNQKTELAEIKSAMEELKASFKTLVEDRTFGLQNQVQELEKVILDKTKELQESQAQVIYLEKIIQKLRLSDSATEASQLLGQKMSSESNSYLLDGLNKVTTLSHDTQVSDKVNTLLPQDAQVSDEVTTLLPPDTQVSDKMTTLPDGTQISEPITSTKNIQENYGINCPQELGETPENIIHPFSSGNAPWQNSLKIITKKNKSSREILEYSRCVDSSNGSLASHQNKNGFPSDCAENLRIVEYLPLTYRSQQEVCALTPASCTNHKLQTYVQHAASVYDFKLSSPCSRLNRSTSFPVNYLSELTNSSLTVPQRCRFRPQNISTDKKMGLVHTRRHSTNTFFTPKYKQVTLSPVSSDLPASKSDIPASRSYLTTSRSDIPANRSELLASKSDIPANKSDRPANTSDRPANRCRQTNTGCSLVVKQR